MSVFSAALKQEKQRDSKNKLIANMFPGFKSRVKSTPPLNDFLVDIGMLLSMMTISA